LLFNKAKGGINERKELFLGESEIADGRRKRAKKKKYIERHT